MSLREACTRVFAAGGPLAARLPGWRERDGQVAMTAAIADAIDEAATLVVEAGTGTGKTFAYLVPALLSARRILIATGSKTLQDQLFGRDLPAVREALGVPVTVALLKGRANYLCRHRIRRHLDEGRFESRDGGVQLRRIDRHAQLSEDGDRAGVVGVPEDSPVWPLATSTRDNCLGQDCGDFERCFVFKARQTAQLADVVVVNHHLFCADLALRDEGVSELLPSTDAIIFDEAHQLPAVASDFFGATVSTRQLLELARDVEACGLAEARDAGDWSKTSRDLEQALRELRLAAGTEPRRIDGPGLRQARTLVSAITAVATCLDALGRMLGPAADRGRDLRQCHTRWQQLDERLLRWLRGVDPTCVHGLAEADRIGTDDEGGPDVASADEAVDGPQVDWLEIHGSGVTLHSTPLSIAVRFAAHRAGRPRAWIFCSATLAIAGRFDHFQAALGLDDARGFVWPSPFDFGRQALLYVPPMLPAPADTGFAPALAEAIWPLLVANRGRAFILCTTLRMVGAMGRLLQERVGATGEPLDLLVQGAMPRAEMLDSYRRLPAPVLVGSASFWEGVDVPGRQLSLVVIDKLPFAPPDDPVLRARIDASRRSGRDPFRDLQLPQAALMLKQGAGRLIRSEQDHGVLVIGDERLASRGYGRTLVKSLPPFARTRDPAVALAAVIRHANIDAGPEVIDIEPTGSN